VILFLAASFDLTCGILSKRHFGENERDGLHITARPQKRDDVGCPTAYFLCPASMNGGCCPTDRSCGTDSCLPTTAGPQSGCGKAGYIACDIAHGGSNFESILTDTANTGAQVVAVLRGLCVTEMAVVHYLVRVFPWIVALLHIFVLDLLVKVVVRMAWLADIQFATQRVTRQVSFQSLSQPRIQTLKPPQ